MWWKKTGKIKTPGSSGNLIFLDITDRVNSGANERGLLGMAFHPDYKNNGYLFVNYTGGNGQTVVARYTRSAGDSLKADASTEKVLMTIAQPFNNHNVVTSISDQTDICTLPWVMVDLAVTRATGPRIQRRD